MYLGVPTTKPVCVEASEPACSGDVPGDFQGVLERELLLAVETAAKRLAFDVRHHEVQEPSRLARIEQRDDVRMLHAGGDLNLREDPLCPKRRRDLRAEHLECHLASVLGILSEVNDGHAASSQLALDDVSLGEGGVQTL
jgi:hypothetical protein